MEEPDARLVQLDLRPNPRTLRGFGWALALACVGRGAWHAWNADAPPSPDAQLAVLSGCAATLSLLAWRRPSLLRAPYLVLTLVTYPIRWLAAVAALATLYFAVLTPVAWAVRVHRRLSGRSCASGAAGAREPASTWVDVHAPPRKQDYFRQF